MPSSSVLISPHDRRAEAPRGRLRQRADVCPCPRQAKKHVFSISGWATSGRPERHGTQHLCRRRSKLRIDARRAVGHTAVDHAPADSAAENRVILMDEAAPDITRAPALCGRGRRQASLAEAELRASKRIFTASRPGKFCHLRRSAPCHRRPERFPSSFPTGLDAGRWCASTLLPSFLGSWRRRSPG